MNKVQEIIQSWAIGIKPTEEQKQIASVRLQICMGCESWTESPLGIKYCKECGCATKGKVFTPVGLKACPKGKWTI